MIKSFRTQLTFATLLACSITLTACGTKLGGDTTCSEFSGLESSKKNEAVKNLLSEGGDSDAGSIKVGITKASVIAYCGTAGEADSPIGSINGG